MMKESGDGARRWNCAASMSRAINLKILYFQISGWEGLETGRSRQSLWNYVRILRFVI